jgi:predicted DCC family thiol-disulfide oxidoreductase YuxK
MNIPSATYPLTIYYDASCPLCNAEICNLRLRDTQSLLRLQDASSPAFSGGPVGVSHADLMTLIHAVTNDGRLVKGVEVFRLAYAAVGLGWVVAITGWPLVGRLADALYPVIARNRHHIPRFVAQLLFGTFARRAAVRASQCKDGTCSLKSL